VGVGFPEAEKGGATPTHYDGVKAEGNEVLFEISEIWAELKGRGFQVIVV